MEESQNTNNVVKEEVQTKPKEKYTRRKNIEPKTESAPVEKPKESILAKVDNEVSESVKANLNVTESERAEEPETSLPSPDFITTNQISRKH